MFAIRHTSSRLFAVSLIFLVPILVTTLIIGDLVDRGRHTVGTMVDAEGHTWYAKDNHTLFQTDLVNTHVLYAAEDGLRRKEFHLFNPVVIEASATASQVEVWKHFFGVGHALRSSPTLTVLHDRFRGSRSSESTPEIGRRAAGF
jgi:hypothetical protein